MASRFAYLLIATSLLAGCRTGRNYPDTEGPRYSGRPAPDRTVRPARGDMVRVVSFNIAFGRRADSAIVVLKSNPALRRVDVILLQEMDAQSARRVAEELEYA